MSASWDWAAWGISIAISIATSIACFAFSALSKPGSFKALKNAIKHLLKMAKAGLNAAKKGLSQNGVALKNIPKVLKGEISRQDCSQALKYQVKNAGVCILKEVASQGILKGVQKLEELEIEELISVLGNEIKPAIEKGLSCQSGNIFDEVLFLYDFQVAMADENFKIHEEKKLLESIVHSAKIVLHDR